ncbi:MAG: trypsin-like serine protease [Pseudomonadota bacterium]
MGRSKSGQGGLGPAQAEEPPLRLEAIIGDADTRRPVHNVADAPWRPMCLMRLHYTNGATAIGSGVLIAPDLILTAAHNLYSLKLKTLITGADVWVGAQNGSAAASGVGVWAKAHPKYTKNGPGNPARFNFDYGLLKLKTTKLGDWAGDVFDVAAMTPPTNRDLLSHSVVVAGYPADRTPATLTAAEGPVLDDPLSNVVFGYQMDTAKGQSGGPVFRHDPATGRTSLAGVHVAGFHDHHFNLARRFSAKMKKEILTWSKEADREAGGALV